MIETLNTEGFLFSEIAGEWHVLKAEFGDGYGAAALVGAPGGTRSWSVRITALPDAEIVETRTRAAYIWQFFRATKAAGDQPFWIEIEDPETGTRKSYLASFVDSKLTYEVLCAKVYGTGLDLRERRVAGTVSPVVASLAPRVAP